MGLGKPSHWEHCREGRKVVQDLLPYPGLHGKCLSCVLENLLAVVPCVLTFDD